MQKLIYSFILLCLGYVLPAQTATQNYIKKTVPISPVSTEVNLGILSSAYKIESINYLDGLGRTIQDVLVKASPNNYDLVQPMVYDQYGRQSISYLPYADATNDGSFKTNAMASQLNFYANSSKVAKTTTPFSRCYFDSSPLNSVRETTAPDTDWQLGNGHTTKVEQSFNTLQGDAILLWELQSNGDYSADGSNYPDNTLAMTKVTDPNGNYSLVYTDKEGKTICTKQFLEMRTVGSSQVPYYLTTYLVYDLFGQLVLVIPPKALDLMNASANYSVNALSQDLVYRYVYDERHRLIEKKVLGTGWTYIVYNRLNQPVLFQDANLKLQNKWSFVKYDVLGRPILSGLFNAAGLANYQTRALAQAQLNGSQAVSGESRVAPNASNPFGYTNLTLPNTNLDILSVNHYDDYDFDNNGIADYSFNATPIPCLMFNNGTTQGINTGIQGAIGSMVVLGSNLGYVRQSNKDDKLMKALENCQGSYASLRTLLENALSLSQSLFQTETTETINSLKNTLVGNISNTLTDLQKQISTCREIDAKKEFDKQLSMMAGMADKAVESVNAATSGVNILMVSCQPYNNTASSRTRGYLTGSRVKVLDAANPVQWEVSTVFYDEEGQAIQAQSNDHLGATDLINMVYDFVGNVIHTQQLHSLASQAGIQVLNHMSFDKMGRLQRLDQKNNNDVPVVLSTYAYNELSQLIDKKVHSIDNGSNFLQSMDYRYHIQGWLRSINNSDLASDMAANPLNGTNDDTNDLWGMELNYNSNTAGINGAKQYTGNIAEKKWKSSTDNIKRGYGYTYDKADRLTAASYKEGTSGTWGAGANGRSFDENLSYDANGNILSLSRTGCQSSGTSFGLIDNLTYKYNGNFLAAVNDASPTQGYLADFKDNGSTATSGEYTYDGNGNLTANANKKITSIVYNHLDLPTQINFVGGNKIEYTYDASGVRLRKKVTNGSNILTKNYCGAFEYTNNVLELMHTSEGRCVPTNASGTLSFRYEYHYADNTGNITLAFSDLDNNGSIATNEVIQESSYYAFGMRMEGLATPQIGVEHKYKFGGKELQDELGLNELDFGARFYDPAIARWGCIDPMADEAPHRTPFRFCFNNPLTIIDPTGMYEVSDQIGGGADHKGNRREEMRYWADTESSDGDPFGEKKYNVGKPKEKNTQVSSVEYNAGSFIVNTNGEGPSIDYEALLKSDYMKEQLMEGVHSVFDGLGLIPGGGEIFDGINAGIYAIRGDYLNAGISLGAAVPFVGWAATGGKLAKKVPYIYKANEALVKAVKAAKEGSQALTKTGVQWSKHSLQRLAERGVTKKMAETAISKGQKFYDPLNKSINYVLPNAFASGKSLLVGTNPLTGQVTTVLRSSKNLINSRFIPIK